MRTNLIGLIGGMSYQSSLKYLQKINDAVNAQLGGLHCAQILYHNVDFAKIEQLMQDGEWDEIGWNMAEIAESLVNAGAYKVAIATNTVHKVAKQVTDLIGRDRFIHIAECIAGECHKANAQKMLLLGTAETMSGDVFRERLCHNGLTICVPSVDDQHELNQIIFDELCKGKVEDASVEWYMQIIANAITSNRGVDGIILGCTELSMLKSAFELSHMGRLMELNGHKPFIVVDSLEAHVAGIVEACLEEVD